MAKRRKTPQATETEVLTKSARRCCICFGLQMDLSPKKGQIAHLDGNRSNSDFDNLAWLCIPHHDDYDSITRQSKGLTIHEVKTYRTLLYEAIRQIRNESQPISEKQTCELRQRNTLSTEISDLLAKVQSRTIPLSQCLTEALILAQKAADSSLEIFCRKELSGYSNGDPLPLTQRDIDVFISGNARINLQSPSWGSSVTNIVEYMQRDREHFVPHRLWLGHAISMIEEQAKNLDPQKGIIILPIRVGDINPEAEDPNTQLVAYAHPAAYLSILESVRRELTVHLLDLLPRVDDERN